MRIRFLPKKNPDPGLCTSQEGIFLKVYRMNILDHCKSPLFCFQTFGVRRTIDVLDSETSRYPVNFGPDPGPEGLQGTSDTISMKTKKKVLKII